ncbi:MAG: type II toxin-antitoxin system YafQ family toxin [Pontiella sp.]
MKLVSQTKQFSRDIRRMKKRGKDLDKLKIIIRKLGQDKILPSKNKDHALIGSWKPSRDCHIESDWLLIYTTDDDSLRLERTGTHSDLFKK